VASLVGGVFGSLTQTPGFLIGVGAVLAFSALSFAGWLPFPMSNRLLNFVTQMGQTRHPLIQAFLMGAGLGIVASPCVGPILVAVLSGLSAAQVSPLTGFLLLTVFGLGMSTPFLALALIAHHLGTSPRLSGQSLSWIKNIGAIALLGASLFFLVPGIKLLRVTKSTEAHFTFPVQNLSEWKGQKWTVIDFRADWCAACLDLDTKTFSSKNVSAYFTPNSEGFSSWDFVRVDFTESNSNTEALAKQWGVVGLPTVIFTNPNGTICKEQSLFRFEGPQEFSERLERVKAQCQR
jgi:thiol:disulfide interchange protein DsbD